MMRQRIHIALAVKNLEESIIDYSKRLGVKPCWKSENQYGVPSQKVHIFF